MFAQSQLVPTTFVMSGRPRAHTYYRGFHCTNVSKIWHCRIIWQFEEIVQIRLKSWTNVGHSTWTPKSPKKRSLRTKRHHAVRMAEKYKHQANESQRCAVRTHTVSTLVYAQSTVNQSTAVRHPKPNSFAAFSFGNSIQHFRFVYKRSVVRFPAPTSSTHTFSVPSSLLSWGTALKPAMIGTSNVTSCLSSAPLITMVSIRTTLFNTQKHVLTVTQISAWCHCQITHHLFPYSTNELVFVLVNGCVYYAVQTELLNYYLRSFVANRAWGINKNRLWK